MPASWAPAGVRGPLAPGSGFPARAIGAIKSATATALGLPLPRSTQPLTPPTDAFAAAVAAVSARAGGWSAGPT